MTNDHINVRNVYIELLNKLKMVEGVDIQYIDHLVDLLNQDIYLVETDVQWIESLIPSGASSEDQLVKHSDLPSFTQVNSDWNATSGVAEILNKPTIPAAQVNSDWNAASGVAQILNKPSEMFTYVFRVDQTGWTFNSQTNLYEYTLSRVTKILDETKTFTLSLVPLSDNDHVITSGEAVSYSGLVGVSASNVSVGFDFTIYANVRPSTEIKLHFDYWGWNRV